MPATHRFPITRGKGPGGRLPARYRQMSGFSLIELMLVVALIAIAAAFALPTYTDYIDRTKVSRIVVDFGNIQLAVNKYRLSNNDALPPDLGAIGMGNLRDPWGQAYYYLPYDNPANSKDRRKDHNLHPLNSDYDLFSSGKDMDWKPPLTAKASRDDIVRGRDGQFVGLATDF